MPVPQNTTMGLATFNKGTVRGLLSTKLEEDLNIVGFDIFL